MVILFIAGKRAQETHLNPVKSREDLAARYHHTGMLAVSTDIDTALAYLRAAVKAMPLNTEYLNDLGVTEANANLLHLAKKRFSAALRVDPNNEHAFQNYQRTKKDLQIKPQNSKSIKSNNLNPSLSAYHYVLPLDEIDTIPSLNSSEDVATIFRKPFIIRNAFQELSSIGSNISFIGLLEYLKTAPHGNSMVDFYPQNMHLSQPEKLFFIPLSKAIQQIVDMPDMVFRDVDASQMGSYAQWNMNRTAWSDALAVLNITTLPYPFQSFSMASLDSCYLSDPLLSCLADNGGIDTYLKATHWYMMLIGEEGAGMHNHQDDLGAASFQLQITGSKRWSICPPEDSLWNGTSWVRRAQSSNEGNYMYGPAKINMFSSKINYGKYPRLINATCYHGVVNAGDLVYYPQNFWHQTLNLNTPTVSISANVITKECREAVSKRLKVECNELFVDEDEKLSFTPNNNDLQQQRMIENNNRKTSRYGFHIDFCNSFNKCVH